MSAVAASVAVICAVALTNSVALSDAEGTSVEADRVVVPSSGIAASGGTDETPSAVETPTPEIDTVTPEPEPGPDAGDEAAKAEVVPAPAPEIVAPSTAAPPAEPPVGPVVTPSDDVAIAEAEASGSWDSVRERAVRLGWSAERIDAWIAKLEKARASAWGHRRDDDRRTQGDDRNLQQTDSERPVDAERPGRSDSDRRADDSDSGGWVSTPDVSTKKDQERSKKTDSSKERPANAGANADNRSEKPGVGAKKDRSRDSPERRDR